MRNPAKKASSIAHVRSSLVGWSPPRTQGMATITTAIASMITSFTNRAVDPVTSLIPRMRMAESTFATRSRTQRHEEHPSPERLQGDQSEREAEGDREEDQRDPGASPEVGHNDLACLLPPAKAGLHVEEDPHEEKTHQRRRDLSHAEEERVRNVTHGLSVRPPGGGFKHPMRPRAGRFVQHWEFSDDAHLQAQLEAGLGLTLSPTRRGPRARPRGERLPGARSPASGRSDRPRT
jgi:hypothetical protein